MSTRSYGIAPACLMLAFLFTSCFREDPGSLQNDSRTYNLNGFDKASAGDALDITIVQGSNFAVTAQGDRRNLDDLQLDLQGTNLQIKFKNSRNRQYTTYVTLVMPVLHGLAFSGAVNGRASGFSSNMGRVDMTLSGASVGQFEFNSDEVYLDVSGASKATLTGAGKKVEATISGASTLTSFDFSADEVNVNATGASHARVTAIQQLNAVASGASEVIYRGNPQVAVNASGASTIRKE